MVLRLMNVTDGRHWYREIIYFNAEIRKTFNRQFYLRGRKRGWHVPQHHRSRWYFDHPGMRKNYLPF